MAKSIWEVYLENEVKPHKIEADIFELNNLSNREIIQYNLTKEDCLRTCDGIWFRNYHFEYKEFIPPASVPIEPKWFIPVGKLWYKRDNSMDWAYRPPILYTQSRRVEDVAFFPRVISITKVS